MGGMWVVNCLKVGKGTLIESKSGGSRDCEERKDQSEGRKSTAL